MGCVNTSSRKFKELAAKNNVDINALELITHKYWLEKGSEEFFPTDVYIQAQLGNVQYEEHGKAIQEMWKNNYSTPLSFNSLEELTAAQQEARKYFPQHALVHYKDAKGRYILRVKQPVKKISVTKGLLDNGFLSNVARINLGLQNDATYDIDKVQELFEKFNQDRTSRFLADKVFKAAKDLGLKITFDDSISISAPGRYTNDNTIKFNKAFFERDWMNNRKASILLHEVIHAMTMYALSDKTQGWQKPEAIQHFANEINSIFQDVRNNAALEGERGKTDVKEFVAELANPIFRKKLQSIDKGSFWNRIVNAIKSFLGIKTASTYYNRAINALNEALDAFDMDTYTKYTKIGDILQQAYQQESIDRGLSESEIKQSIKEHYLNVLSLATALDETTKERLRKARLAANAERNTFTYASENEEEYQQRERVNKRIDSFEKDYGDLVKRIVPTNNGRGGMSYSVTLKSVKEILEGLNAPILRQLSMIDNMTKDDILSNMMLLEQEAADYILVNKERSNSKPSYYNGTPDSYEGFITPSENTIFVFGSNPEGRHGAGSAKVAKDKFGAIYGQGEGLQGNSYALPTKDLRIKENNGLRSISPKQITENIKRMYAVAEMNPNLEFKVSYTNDLNEKTLNGYTGAEMIQMFKDAGPIPVNVIFSKNWTDHWNEIDSSITEIELPLPNYASFQSQYGNMGETVIVDAEWKIPLLQDLDERMANETSEEQKNTADEIEEVLDATDESTYISLEEKEEKKTQRNLSNFERLINQFNNLLDSDLITASEIRHVAELIVNSISDIITACQTEEGFVEQRFPNLNSSIDFQKASRRDIVETLGVNRLVYLTKDLFKPENANYEDLQTMMQAQLIIDNWDAVMSLASDIFAANEGFGITANYDKGGFKLADGTNIDYDNFNEQRDTETTEENYGDEQEHWQIESRTIDILNSMSQLVRLALHDCYQLDKDGKQVMSKWGIAERVNPRKAVNSILRWTQGSQSLEDMIKRLAERQDKQPWVSQLINRLSDQSGKEADFQSQFYGVFQKHFQPYSIVLLEDGKYTSIPVNNHPALTEAMTNVTTQYKIGEHPLFTQKGINSKLLGSDKTTGVKDEMNLHKALTVLNTIQEGLSHGEEFDTQIAEEASANIAAASKILGYPISEEMLSDITNQENVTKMTKALRFIISSLDQALKEQQRNPNTNYNPFAYNGENSIAGSLRNFLSPITDILEDTAINAFYDSGKMYQSYVTPSFMTKLMNKFRLEGQEFEDFIMNEYGNSEWFKFAGAPNIGWRNEWLRQLARDSEARKVFDHKVELNFNKHNYMRNMSDAEYTLSLITEYLAEGNAVNKNLVPAWFRVPMQSNKPSSEFIKFYSYRGETYKDEIVNGLYNMFLQELSRIQTVRMRNLSKESPDFIQNFDSNGRRFNFLPFLNEYIDGRVGNLLSGEGHNKRLSQLLEKKLNGNKKLSSQEEATLLKLTQEAIRNHMEERVNKILDDWERNGILEAAKTIKGINEDTSVRNIVENFLWNDSFASKNILQLTIGDIAFYKDAEDLQKRLAQLHAPGVRGNINAIDYNGNKVSDGKYRTFILKDFDNFKSNLIANISEVFDKRIATAPEDQKAQLKALKESLVGKNGKYTKINVADAQGYSSPSSYRKKAFIFGKWSREAEDIYQKLLRGNYNYTDLETAFQPLKPFVYSHLQKDMGVNNAPIHTMPVPFQAKNAEYLLIMADAILKGEKLSRPNLLRAVYRVMEESEKLNPTKGIDTVQFESAIKSGLQGKIDINQFTDPIGGEEAAYVYIMSQLYKQNSDGTRSKEYNTTTFVHEASYEDYCLQQEVPAHFKNHAQVHGSQIRMIIPSDLDFYKNPNGDLTAEDNKVYYEWAEPDGTQKKLTANEFKQEYENTIADNIQQSLNELSEELHFNSLDKKEQNIALSKILQREILSSPRYGVDLIQACSIDKETGNFRIPKGDPIQAKRIEQLINSIIKNRVNKQKIAGGPIVQVSNFGTSKQLHIRFNDKNGNLLMTEEEFKASDKQGTYKQYVKDNQAGIAYFEAFAPIWSEDIFKKFSNKDGSINVEAIEATNPELLKMISYRIPTEDKYSMAPTKIVGFMPREAGDAIMLPYELTEIDDSDFDVDKRYVMRKDIPIKRRKASEIEQMLFDKLSESYSKAHDGKKANKYIGEQVRMFMNNPEKMKYTDSLMEALYKEYQRIAYYTEAPTSGRTYRDNKIIDMTWAVLTNEMTADKILNPGGFDNYKKVAYQIAAFREGNVSWDQLQQMSIDELKELSSIDKDLSWADTQVHFYRQNAAGSNLIGVFAVNKVAHATLESNDILLAVDEICGEEPFTIAGMTFGGRMYLDPKYDINGNLIGKTIGSGVSASADTAKEPTLDLINVNMITAGIFNAIQRLGMPMEDAALVMAQSAITKVLSEFNRKNLVDYEPLSHIVEKRLAEIRDQYNIDENSNINTEPLTREELIEGLTDAEHDVIDYKVLSAFQKFRAIADAVRKPTFATRFNSMASAVGPLIIDNLIIEHRMQQFSDGNSTDKIPFYNSKGQVVDINSIFEMHPILQQFAQTVNVAASMFDDMPMGSIQFRSLLNRIPSSMLEKFYNDRTLLDKLGNFYQSYLLIASKFINPEELSNYINGFPAWFMKQNYKEKYAGNELIEAIRMNVNKKTDRSYLTINITGADTQIKESLGNAWVDLHKTDPVLSERLFNYCFFRAGVGFSPKTFMSLVPTYVKEKLNRTLEDGTTTSYIGTYRVFPQIAFDLVIDQFIRNNWTNNKLVPNKGGKGTKYMVDMEKGILLVTDPSDLADLKGVSYMKTKNGGQTILWKFIGKEEDNLTIRAYRRVKPLGNNGEYLEMSLDDIQNPLANTTKTTEDVEISEMAPKAAAETEAVESTEEVKTPNKLSKEMMEFVDLVMLQRESIGRPISKSEATNRVYDMMKNPESFGNYMVNVFKQKGLTLSKEEAIKEFKKMC